MAWFSWLTKNETSLLAKQLKHYPPYLAPHCGDHIALTLDQSRANLNYLLAHKNERIQHLAKLLEHFEIDLQNHLSNGDYQRLLKQLYPWASNEWPTAIQAEHATRKTWQTTHRKNEHILYSVAMDVSITIGEMIIRQRPTFKWAIDLDPKNIKDQMLSANRIVLAAPSQIVPESTSIIDIEINCAAMIFNNSPSQRALNLWLKQADDAISGLVEGTWINEEEK